MTPTAPLSALILAGSRSATDEVASAEGAPHKALIEVGGASMIARVHAALKGAGVERVFVSADNPDVVAFARGLGAEIVQPEAGPSASVAKVFAQSGAPLIVTTADHALLRPEWLRELIDGGSEADLAIMLARREKVEAVLPGTRRTWWHFADGHWSGCNLFYLRTPEARHAIDGWREVDRNRKRPWRIAVGLGLPTLTSYAMGRLGLRDAIARLGTRMGCRTVLVSASDGRAAIDVDKLSDLVDVRRLIAETTTA